MAITAFGTNDPQSVQLWSKVAYRESLKGTMLFRKLLGKDGDKRAVIYRHKDLEKSAGDTIKYDILMQANGSGATGDERLKDNEEEMVYHQDSIVIDQLRNAHAFRRMSQQRTIHKMRTDAQTNLSDWHANKLETYWLRAQCGDTSLTHGQTAVAPDAAHMSICGDRANEAAITSSDYVTLDELDYAKEKALMADPPVRQVKIEGSEYFVVILHTYSVTDLKLNLGSGTYKWMDIQQYANVRGLKNPIFTGALGVYNGMILFESPRIYSPTANVYRNLLLGSQAGAYAVGSAYDAADVGTYGKQEMSWNEQTDDGGNEKAIFVGSIFGVKKVIFDSTDYGTMTIPSYSKPKR